MPIATTTQAGREVLTPAAEKIMNDREQRRQAARAGHGIAPISADDAAREMNQLFPEKVGRAPLETIPALRPGPSTPFDPAQGNSSGVASGEQPHADLPCIEIQTTVEHRGRAFTVVARGYTLDQLCDMLDKRGYAAQAQTQEWQSLPDGTPICPKHHTPMRKRERQGDTWYSHSAGKGQDGKDVYCKGYHGKDSPGYDVD